MFGSWSGGPEGHTSGPLSLEQFGQVLGSFVGRERSLTLARGRARVPASRLGSASKEPPVEEAVCTVGRD